MSAIDKFQKLFDKITSKKGEQWMEEIPAWLGNHSGTVLTGTRGMIYVRTAEGQVLEVYNSIAPVEYNILVTIGRRKDQPNLWQVIGRREVWSTPASESMWYHNEQHRFGHGDMLPVDRKQVLYLTALASEEPDFNVNVYGGALPTDSGWVEVSNQVIDLSSYAIDAGAKFVSIESDDGGALSVNEGSVFGSILLATAADIPVPASGKYPIAAVLLYEGQESITNDDIMVLTPFRLNGKPMGEQINEADADTPADADEWGFYDVVDQVIKKITWLNIKTALTDLFDTLYAALGHTHDPGDLNVQYRQLVYSLVGDDVDILTADGDAIFSLENLE